ncbi:hypothetical protein, partial [Cellulomonas rhizosphaerae]
MGHGGMQAVDLDEVVDDADVAPAARPRRPRWWWVVVPVALALVAGLVVGQRAIDDRERAVIADLADVPGVLEPVDGHLDVVARAKGVDAAWMFTPDGAVVQASDGSQAYVWRDRHTGAVSGTVPLLGPTPALAGG